MAPRRSRSLVALLFLALASVSIWSSRPPGVQGAQELDERTEEVVARGLRHISVLRGNESTVVRYRVLVGAFDSQARADGMLARLESAGFSAGPHYRRGRYRISVDTLPTQREAETTKASLEAAGFSSGLTIEEYSQDVTHAGGPWEIHVLEASPETVRVEVGHAYDTAIGLETTSGLSRRRGAMAAVNGGYYLRTGILQGDALGVLQLNGTLVSEPDRGRAAFGIIETEGKTERYQPPPIYRRDHPLYPRVSPDDPDSAGWHRSHRRGRPHSRNKRATRQRRHTARRARRISLTATCDRVWVAFAGRCTSDDCNIAPSRETERAKRSRAVEPGRLYRRRRPPSSR